MSMLDWSQCSAVECSAEKVSRAWVFRNSRVPVKALFENLDGGATVDDFLDWFPGVRHDQVVAVLEFTERGIRQNLIHLPDEPARVYTI